MNMAEMLNILRHGDGFCGWGADKHTINHFKEHVWFKKCDGGFTECCDYGYECPHHAELRKKENESIGKIGIHDA